jgi:hypothetical protein
MAAVELEEALREGLQPDRVMSQRQIPAVAVVELLGQIPIQALLLMVAMVVLALSSFNTLNKMAHFAQLDDEGYVIHVSVVRNEDILNGDGEEEEQVGIAFLRSVHGKNTNWVQCSYNARIRRRYPGVGMRYDALLDAFIPAQPDPTWLLNPTSLDWEAPEESEV